MLEKELIGFFSSPSIYFLMYYRSLFRSLFNFLSSIFHEGFRRWFQIKSEQMRNVEKFICHSQRLAWSLFFELSCQKPFFQWLIEFLSDWWIRTKPKKSFSIFVMLIFFWIFFLSVRIHNWTFLEKKLGLNISIFLRWGCLLTFEDQVFLTGFGGIVADDPLPSVEAPLAGIIIPFFPDCRFFYEN